MPAPVERVAGGSQAPGSESGDSKWSSTSTISWRLPPQATEETASSIWGHLMKTNAFERYGFDEDEASLIVGHQLGSNFVVRG